MISVIIPTCNRLDTLKRAVDSVCYQSIEGIEIIIVDDSSDDLTPKIKDMFSEYTDLKIFRNENHGPSKARNKGVKYANNEYITFLDDDDIYLPGRLLNILSFIKKNKDYIFYSSARLYEVNDFSKIIEVKNQIVGEVNLSNNLYQNDIDIGFVIKKSDFLSLGGFDEELNGLEDWDFILRALKKSKGYKLARIDYAVNVDSGRVRVSNKHNQYRINLATKHKADFGDKWSATLTWQGKKSLSIIEAIKYSIYLHNIYPIRRYLRLKIKP